MNAAPRASAEACRGDGAGAGAPRESEWLQRVRRGDLCSGCGLCALASKGKVEMAPSDDGFLRPVQRAELGDQENRIIAETCPGLRATQPVPEGARMHGFWGPYIGVRRGHATDAALRRNASSGGALSALLIHLLARGEVDYVVQTGASPTVPYANVTVRSLGADDVFAAAGSRYAPSAPLADLDDLLDGEGRFAFVGKPCDVAALRALARFDPRIDRKVAYAISFFCAGVPSLSGARAVLNRLGVEREADVTSFRYRGDGWPGYATATLRSGERKRMSYADSWGGILSRHVQFRCKICPDGVGGLADVVCADAWHCDDKGYPLFEEQDGWSLIVSRTPRGEALVGEAMAARAIQAEDADIEGVAAMQPGQHKRKALALSRIAAMAVLLKPVPRFEGFALLAAARSRGPLANLRSFLGTLRRLLLPGTRRRRGAGAKG